MKLYGKLGSGPQKNPLHLDTEQDKGMLKVQGKVKHDVTHVKAVNSSPKAAVATMFSF